MGSKHNPPRWWNDEKWDRELWEIYYQDDRRRQLTGGRSELCLDHFGLGGLYVEIRTNGTLFLMDPLTFCKLIVPFVPYGARAAMRALVERQEREHRLAPVLQFLRDNLARRAERNTAPSYQDALEDLKRYIDAGPIGGLIINMTVVV